MSDVGNYGLIKRRSFLGKVGGVFPLIYLQKKALAANDRLQIAAIGVGGKGGSDMQHLARHGELIAACDISGKKLDYALRNFTEVAKFSDYREMISHMGEKIDVLSISTADHTHAHAAQLALNYGIHLFVQTPLSHTPWEARQIIRGSKSKTICTQLGLQGCASNNFRKAVEYLQSGYFGEILEIHAWTNRPTWPQSPEFIIRPSEKQVIPKNLNWDAFIGPAEERPYNQIYQPYNWRGWRDFGSGALGDAGVHLLSLPVMGCHLSAPKEVKCMLSGPVNDETFPAWGILKFEFLNNNKKVPLFWYEGKIGHLNGETIGQQNLPSLDLFFGKKPSANGCLIRGTKGTLLSSSLYGTTWEVHLGSSWLKSDILPSLDQELPRNGRGDSGMKEELVQAIRAGNPSLAFANFNNVSELSEITTIGNAALLSGGGFKWDSDLCASDRTDVNNLITKSYRKGWAVMSV